jgi:ClpX C4-type zinc finger
MPLTGQAKSDYMRDYHRRRSTAQPSVVSTCSFCGEPGSPDRLLVGDQDAIICEECITLAVARIAEARGR